MLLGHFPEARAGVRSRTLSDTATISRTTLWIGLIIFDESSTAEEDHQIRFFDPAHRLGAGQRPGIPSAYSL